MSPATDAIHGPFEGGGAGSFSDSGCPDSRRETSGSGPFGPIFFGVWQSPQPMLWTRYRPRSTAVVVRSLAFVCAHPEAPNDVSAIAPAMMIPLCMCPPDPAFAPDITSV